MPPSLLLKRLFSKAIFQDQDALIHPLKRQIKAWHIPKAFEGTGFRRIREWAYNNRKLC